MRQLGETIYWVESGSHYGQSIPCPMCFGKKFVTIILGDESKTQIECGFCSHGIERPSGHAKTWGPVARVKSGQITAVSNRYGVTYEVGHHSISEYDIFDTKEEAEVKRDIEFKRVSEQAEEQFREHFVNCKAKQIWSAGYHKTCIASAERTIEWHKMRLNMIGSKLEAENRSAE